MTAHFSHPLTSADIAQQVDELGERMEQLEKAVTDWRDDPRAMVILDSIKRNPPKEEWRTATYAITRDEWWEYTGFRVECLKHIYGEHEKRHRLPAQMTGDWTAFDQFLAFPTVQDAIADVLNPPAEREPFPTVDMMLAEMAMSLRPSPIAWGMKA